MSASAPESHPGQTTELGAAETTFLEPVEPESQEEPEPQEEDGEQTPTAGTIVSDILWYPWIEFGLNFSNCLWLVLYTQDPIFLLQFLEIY